jgi:hypothetical protein
MLGGLGVAAKAFEERRMQALTDIFGEGDWFGVAKDLDGFAGGVDDHSAVGAAGKV